MSLCCSLSSRKTIDTTLYQDGQKYIQSKCVTIQQNSADTMSFNVSEANEWVLQYEKVQNEVESQLFEKLTTEVTKDKYVYGKLKMWKERIRTNFHGQDVQYDMYCNATRVLKIDSVNKQIKNYYPQACVEECKYTDAESQQCNMLSDDDDDDDDGFFEVKKIKKIFVTFARVKK